MTPERFSRSEESGLRSLVFEIWTQVRNEPWRFLRLKKLNSPPHYSEPLPLVVWLHMCSPRSIRHPQMMKFHFDFSLCFLLSNLLAGLGKRWAYPRHRHCRGALCSCSLCFEAMAAAQWRLQPLRSELVDVELIGNGLAPYGWRWLLKALVPALEIFDGIVSVFESQTSTGNCRHTSEFFARICSSIICSCYPSFLYFSSSEYSCASFQLLGRNSLPILANYHSNWRRILVFAASSHTQLLSSLASSLNFSDPLKFWQFLLYFGRPLTLCGQSCCQLSCCCWCWCSQYFQGFHFECQRYQYLRFCAHFAVDWPGGPSALFRCSSWNFQIWCWLHGSDSMRHLRADYHWRWRCSWSFVSESLAQTRHYFLLCSEAQLFGGLCIAEASLKSWGSCQ